jgi:hypothetical protein
MRHNEPARATRTFGVHPCQTCQTLSFSAIRITCIHQHILRTVQYFQLLTILPFPINIKFLVARPSSLSSSFQFFHPIFFTFYLTNNPYSRAKQIEVQISANKTSRCFSFLSYLYLSQADPIVPLDRAKCQVCEQDGRQRRFQLLLLQHQFLENRQS